MRHNIRFYPSLVRSSLLTIQNLSILPGLAVFGSNTAVYPHAWTSHLRAKEVFPQARRALWAEGAAPEDVIVEVGAQSKKDDGLVPCTFFQCQPEV